MQKSLIDYEALTDDELMDCLFCQTLNTPAERQAQLDVWRSRHKTGDKLPSPTVKTWLGEWFLRFFSEQARIARGGGGDRKHV